MKEKDSTVATGLVLLMLILLFGSAFHGSPRFAGSFWGGVLAVVGALLMLFPLVYMVIKRFRWLKRRVTKTISMKTLLAWHVYAGIVGPILVILHSSHKFESPLGIALTALTVVVVLSGFVGRYLMSRFSKEIREKKAMLRELQGAYSHAQAELAENPAEANLVRPFSGLVSRVIGSFFLTDDVAIATSPTSPATLLRVTESIADVEYAIATHEKVKSWFGKWLKWHIVISFVLYGLMALHVWGAIHFGLRWFDSWTPSTLGRGPVVVTSPVKADEFSTYFGRAFERYWRPAVDVNGIRTTVFDYSAMAAAAKQPTSDFSRATETLKQTDPYRFETANRAKAFWLNVYNFGAMKIAADNYPINSITDRKVSVTGDPWGLNIVNVGGRAYSLREIEKKILLPQFGDPRIVFAVSCAAVSCPDRSAAIFSGERLDTQLDTMIRELLTNPEKGLKLDRASNVLTLSWIIKADSELFGNGQKDGILEFVERYAAADVVGWIQENGNEIKVEFFEHDWTLNDSAQAD
ncbi:MAG: hypothetical protein BMS9Abin37_0158 [Acidobacteriota bacterium]|nr:MAG: hypothetical protein BMS9Abin37_0158 [Acidobacteriota bacterium]